jgi:hypothetical protein
VNSTEQTRRTLSLLATSALTTTVLVVTLGALPAAARQEAGPAPEPATTSTFCAIERVGTQYVACDNLTGNGVEAPAWVAAR